LDNEQDTDDAQDDVDAATMEDIPKPAAPIAADAEELTDPDDVIPLDGVSYLSKLAEAQ
jgi:hypothetical protein